jgi:hypothetical protein
MNTTAILIIVFLLALVWFTTNALTAAALIGGKKDELMDKFIGKDKASEELHKRVDELKGKE